MIFFYLIDYVELVGCCDCVVVMYDGVIMMEFKGKVINEEVIVVVLFNINM